MAVNEPSPRAQPEDEVCLLSHKITGNPLLYIPPDWFIAPKQMCMLVASIATELKI